MPFFYSVRPARDGRNETSVALAKMTANPSGERSFYGIMHALMFFHRLAMDGSATCIIGQNRAIFIWTMCASFSGTMRKLMREPRAVWSEG